MKTLLALCALLGTIGCATAATTTSPATAPALDERFTIAIEGARATWTARVNTGGWRLTTDRVTLDGTTLRVFATLERPAEDAMVTQAFATLKGEAASQAATRAELSVRETRRGAAGDGAYAVVAKTGS